MTLNKSSIKEFAYSNRHMLLALLVLLVYLSPNIFFPNQARFLIHDNLDSNVAWYKNLAASGKMFAANDAVIPNSLGGIPRGCYPSELNLLHLFYVWFSPLFAYNLNIILMHLVAFFGMYVFSRRYVFKNNHAALNTGVSLCFALLPFWPSAAMAVVAEPILLYAFLNILNRDNNWKNWGIILFIPFYSVLAFSNLFFCILLSVCYVAYIILYHRRINFLFVAAVVLFGVISVLAENRLFVMQFVEHFQSHRSVMNSAGTLNFKGLIGVSIRHFLFGQYHVLSLQFPFMMLAALCAVIVTKEKSERLKIIAVLAGTYIISLIYILPDWKPAGDMMLKMPFLKIFQLRFYCLFPLIWIVIFAYSINILARNPFFLKKIIPLVFVCFIGSAFFSVNTKDYNTSQFAENSFYNTFITTSDQSFSTFNDYYKCDLFEQVKKKIKPGNYYIGCLGFTPEAAQYNGFNTIDGYFYYYSKAYNQLMNSITAVERAKTGEGVLGSKCNLVSADLTNNKPEITDLALDFDKIKALGTTYIFSAKKITNPRLTGEQVFQYSSQVMYTYTLN